MKAKAKHYQAAALACCAGFLYGMAMGKDAQFCAGFGITAFVLLLVADAARQP